MNWEALKGVIAGQIRAALMTVCGVLIAKGYISEDNILAASAVIAGGVIVLLSSAWSKIKAKYFAEAASLLPAKTSAEEIKTLANEKITEDIPIAKVLP